jgi:hypothetical protein
MTSRGARTHRPVCPGAARDAGNAVGRSARPAQTSIRAVRWNASARRSTRACVCAHGLVSNSTAQVPATYSDVFAQVYTREFCDTTAQPPRILACAGADRTGTLIHRLRLEGQREGQFRRPRYGVPDATGAIAGLPVGRPLLAGAVPVLAPRPAAGPALAIFQLLPSPANATLPGRLLLGILDPADELVARQRCDVLPSIERRRVGDQHLAQVCGQLVHYSTGHSRATHTGTVTRRKRLRRLGCASQGLQ